MHSVHQTMQYFCICTLRHALAAVVVGVGIVVRHSLMQMCRTVIIVGVRPPSAACSSSAMRVSARVLLCQAVGTVDMLSLSGCRLCRHRLDVCVCVLARDMVKIVPGKCSSMQIQRTLSD